MGDNQAYHDYYSDFDFKLDEKPKVLDKEKDLLLGIEHSVIRRYEEHKHIFEKHRSSLSYITSYKILDLYNFMDNIGKTKLHHYILDKSNELLAPDGIRASMTIDKKRNAYILHFNKGGRHILDWIPLYDEIRIMKYDEAIEIQTQIDKAEKLVEEIDEEILVTEVWVKNPRSLWDNGMKGLYVYSIFMPKKYKRDTDLLLSELQVDRKKAQNKVDILKNKLSNILDDKDLSQSIHKLSMYYIYFPRVEKPSNYITIKEGS